MDGQTNPELPIEEISPEDEQLIHPPVYTQKMPIIIPIVGISVILLVIIIIVIVVSGTFQKKNGSQTNAPVPTQQMQPSIAPSSIPAASSSGTTLVSLPPSSLPLILEVSAIGGGATGEKREYSINAKLGKTDKLYVMQRSEAEITGFPGYKKGAVDTGLRIEHDKTYLDIIPVFESAGFPLLNKVTAHKLENKDITESPIYRILLADLKSNFPLPVTKGFIYTTGYVENQEECSSLFEPEPIGEYPACIMEGPDVEVLNTGPVRFICHGSEPDPKWCDSLVDEITISGE